MVTAQDSERRSRHSSARRGRHGGTESAGNFGRGFQALGELAVDGVQVSARATDLVTGRVLFSVDDHVVMPTAGIGTVLLLIEVAARLRDADFGAYTILDRTVADSAGGSGLWQHLQAPSLPVADLAALIGAANDNLATNVLIRAVGLDAVRARTEQLGLGRTALLDLVRDRRGPDDAPQLSVASAKELTWLFTALARGEVVDAEASERVIGWLSLGADLSMVASAFGFDPLAHREKDHGLLLVNKTGTDVGVRSEVGILRGPRAGVTYAVSMSFADTRLSSRLAVLDGMRAVGLDLLEYVH
ncbi:serine hydrolase [Cryobacterium sp. TMT1-21]|uniref:Serine hydrolase n=1 Tax=Cryobacterium shii TaxID=1259235 RepID=A0AAQ2HEC2_9MICO|nr:serine hydrolase [Cryobacterium shii]TFC87621.1 serine hydrolase [Cryobacterium sp. TmT2-59]TFD07371.1 serine hydrolase [Cryobacterium sp. TMT1-21]TFD15643.1 serine hydrolase [Cryobacterium sp. TMT2-23]TFD16458.1 serine hydrolase [Cryobacterium sp. TMT4-10]TFD38575.1 serine hydrolase [Cryobacterium sp. TMT2-10]